VFPASVKPKFYSQEFRVRFAEALLAKRVLVAEGETESLAYSAGGRRLAELDEGTYSSLEALGIASFNARTDSQIAVYGAFFRALGKTTFAVYDKQTDATQAAAIKAAIDHPFEAPTKTFEDLLLAETDVAALLRFGLALVADGEWPQHLATTTPAANMSMPDLRAALKKYLSWAKARGGAADLIGQCSIAEMSQTLKTALAAIKLVVHPSTPAASVAPAPAATPAPVEKTTTS
jgi:putative ATP-dependent endonuclease of OLD family